MSKKGFTLIELIVVIAIIAILATIVVLRIDNPKNKTADAAVKAQMKEIAAQAQLYAIEKNSSFLGMCSDPIMSTALQQINFNSINYGAGGGDCIDSVRDWVVWATLKSGNGKWCMDSMDFMGDRTGETGQCQ